MDAEQMAGSGLEFHAVTPERWADLERLFGPHGACSGCWCMYWRLTRKEFNEQKAAERRAGLGALVAAGRAPGILAYHAGAPIAWCSIAPRETHAALERSRVLARVDDRPVWSITCFFVARPYRRQGLMEDLVRAAVAYALEQGAECVEAYPGELAGRALTGSAGYMGSAATFRRAGFVEVAARSTGHIIMHYRGGESHV